MSASETLCGTVTKLLWSSKRDDFRVLEWIPDRSRDGRSHQRETLVGNWEKPRIGARVEAVGSWQKRKGTQELQFRAQHIHEILPEDASGLLAWLEGGAVKGIGKVTAQKLIDRFGVDLPRVLDTNLDAIAACGIRKKQMERIRDGWAKAQATRIIMQFLRRVGIGPERSRAVWKRFEHHPAVQGDPAALVSRLEDNPYLLTEVSGIGFVLADQAAGKLGIPADSSYRVRAGLHHVLSQAVEDGHVWVAETDLRRSAQELLGVDPNRIGEAIESEIEAKQLVRWDGFLSLRGLAGVERRLADEVRRLNGPAPSIPLHFPPGFTPDPDQQRALETILQSGLVILTGGPGMGKTTLIRACVLSAKAAGLSLLLCAPTGRAAKRMSEVTGHPAATIHRTIEWRSDGPQRHGGNPLAADWIIVDEVSMLDQSLAYKLLCAVKTGTRLLLVGDPHQLPSVGPGNVLGDLLDSGVVPVARLTKIFRQAEFSGIPVLSQAILEGRNPSFPELEGVQFFPIDKGLPAETKQAFVVDRIAEHFRDTGERMQVLSPMKSGPLGTKELNRHLRDLYNPDQGQPHWKWFRVGDFVIQTRNNYDLEVFNGDMGTIVDIALEDDEVTVRVDMDGLLVDYAAEDTEDLEYAWALTIHKAQGGQFPSVCLLSTTDHYVMLKRNLLYTGITRAERQLFLISNAQALAMVRQKTGISHRETRLATLLRGSDLSSKTEQAASSVGSHSDPMQMLMPVNRVAEPFCRF